MNMTNLLGMNANRNIGKVAKGKVVSSSRLSSGKRINNAADDAAGLSISQSMKTQVRGLNKGTQNNQDGINLANVAEGGLEEVSNILQRMRELTVQSANDTNTLSDREQIQKEIDELSKEIDSQSEKVQYNTIKVLDCDEPVVLQDNSNSTLTSNTNYSTVSEDKVVEYLALPKGTPEYTKSDTEFLNSSSSSFSYSDSEERIGSVGDIADDYVPRLTDGDWKEYYSYDSVTTTTVNSVVDEQTTTESLVKVSEPSLMFPAVSTSGIPEFAATTVGNATIDLYCVLTEAKFRDNSTGLVTSLYGMNSVQTISGNTATNVFDPIDGVQITQTITMDANGYKVGFSFENVSGGPVDFDFKFSMDAMNTYNSGDTADATTGTLENKDAKITLSGDADSTYYGNIGNLISSFDVTSTGAFKGHSGASLVWSNSLAVGETSTGQMNYGVEMKSDYYMKTTDVSHDIETTTTTTVDTVSQLTIPEQLAIHVGANENQIINIRLFDVGCLDMGLFYLDDFGNKKAGVNVLSHEDCQQSLGTLDKTIDKIAKYRSSFGSKINRMEYITNANEISELNLSDALSRIEDADMAKEMMNLTSANILEQAGISMLAQSNQVSSKNVIALLQAQ